MQDSTPTPYFPDNLQEYAPWVSKYGLIAPYGECQCGCHQLAPVSKHTKTTYGHVPGQPIRFICSHHHKVLPRPSVAERFWAKVAKRGPDECWLWTASKGTGGYGKVSVNGKHTKASRVAWILTYGAIPDDLWVLHKCDNPPCVNPAHLFLGTSQDNVDDKLEKGRQPLGEKAYQAKLNGNSVAQIRELWNEGMNLSDLGRRFGVSPATISDAVHCRTWRHVP